MPSSSIVLKTEAVDSVTAASQLTLDRSPNKAWESARAAFTEDLSEEEKEVYRDATLEAVQKAVEEIEHDFELGQKRLKIARKLDSFITSLQRYGEIITVFVQAYPLVMAPLWGSALLAMKLVKGYHDYVERLMSMFEKIGENLPRLDSYASLFPNHPSLQNALFKVYTEILRFNIGVRNIFKTESKNKSTISRGLSVKHMWRDFEAEFGNTITRFQELQKLAENEARAAGLIEASKNFNHLRKEEAAAAFERKLSADERLQASGSRLNQQSFHSFFLSMEFEKRESQIYQWLSLPVQYDEEFRTGLSKRGQGTCAWIEELPEFKNWMDSPNRRLLWVHGGVGCGKTVLTCHVITLLQEQRHKPVAYYFCSKSAEAETKALSMLRHWTAQLLLVDAQKNLLRLLALLEQRRIRPSSSTIPELLAAIRDLSSFLPEIILIVDGIDECEPHDRDEILAITKQISENNHILVVSRELPSISKSFTEDIRVIKLTKEIVAPDVAKVIQMELCELFSGCDKNIGSAAVQQIGTLLQQRADGMHLYARLVLDLLQTQTTLDEMKTVARDCPIDLRGIYLQILRDIQTIPESQLRRVVRIFQFVLCASRPLNVDELGEALAVENGMTELGEGSRIFHPEKLLALCKPLIHMNPLTKDVRLIHHSVKENLLSKGLQNNEGNSQENHTINSCINEGQAHTALASTCLTYLSLDHQEISSDDILTAKDIRERYPFFEYAAFQWGHHLARAGPPEKVDGLVNQLRQYLHSRAVEEWVEGAVAMDSSNWGARLLMLEADIKSFVSNLKGVESPAKEELSAGLQALHVRTIEKSQRLHGRTHERTLVLLHSLGHLYLWAGKFKDAQKVLGDLLERKQTLMDESNPSLLETLHDLGVAYVLLGNYDDGDVYVHRAWKGRNESLGPDHPLTLNSGDLLAGISQERGQMEQAETVYRRSLATKLKVLGEDHPDTLKVANNLAIVYREMGKWEDSERLFLQTIECRKRIFGDEHPATLRAVDHFGLLRMKEGKWKEAMALHEQAYRGLERALGKVHIQTIEGAANIAKVLSHQGRWKEAIEIQEPSLLELQSQFGIEHTTSLEVADNLAISYSRCGRLPEAIQLMEAVVKVRAEKNLRQKEGQEASLQLLETWKLEFKQQKEFPTTHIRRIFVHAPLKMPKVRMVICILLGIMSTAVIYMYFR